MNSAYIHLLLNHFPIIGFTLILPLLVYAVYKIDKKLTIVSLIGLILIALLTIPAYITGDGAEGMILGLPGISQEIIEVHESMAFIAFIMIDVLGAFAIAGLFIIKKNDKHLRTISIISLALTIAVFTMMIFVANTGGKIRHTEIRDGYVQPPHEEEIED